MSYDENRISDKIESGLQNELEICAQIDLNYFLIKQIYKTEASIKEKTSNLIPLLEDIIENKKLLNCDYSQDQETLEKIKSL